jgi:hypothetical protein
VMDRQPNGTPRSQPAQRSADSRSSDLVCIDEFRILSVTALQRRTSAVLPITDPYTCIHTACSQSSTRNPRRRSRDLAPRGVGGGSWSVSSRSRTLFKQGWKIRNRSRTKFRKSQVIFARDRHRPRAKTKSTLTLALTRLLLTLRGWRQPRVQ